MDDVNAAAARLLAPVVPGALRTPAAAPAP
jgi:hypothetical protein